MMEPRTLEFIAASCQGQLVAGERSACVSRVCTDSRLAKPGDLFVAIKGDRFDGHDYTGQALGQTLSAHVQFQTHKRNVACQGRAWPVAWASGGGRKLANFPG